MTSQAQLGHTLRTLRKKLSLTLSDLSARTGLSISTLSKAERDQVSLNYSKLVQLSEGLGVDMTALLEGDPSAWPAPGVAGRRSLNRADEGRRIDTPNYRYTYLCTDLLKKRFVPMIVEVRARSLEEFGELVRHPGDEFAFVVEGTVVVHTEHYASAVLRAGESTYFESGMGHGYTTADKGPSRILCVCSAPEAALLESLAHETQAEPGAVVGARSVSKKPRRRRMAA